MTSIPKSLDEITPAFLSGLLAERWPGVEVADIALAGEIHGTATKARLAVDYARDVGAPQIMWLKAGWEPHSAMLGRVGIYAREPRTYWELLPKLPARAPQCFGAMWDEAAYEGVLLLEDLGETGATLNTPRSEVGVDEVERMLAMLAGVHGASAAPGWLDARAWLEPLFHDFGEPGAYVSYMADPKEIAQFLQRPRVADYPRAVCDPDAVHAAMARIGRWAKTPRPHCLLHGDAHIGNSYADAQGRPGLLDWQCTRRGGWAYDVAYYMVSALSTADRRAHERDLLCGYLAALSAAGGPAADWDAAWEDYTTCLAYGFAAWLSNSTDFQPEEFNAIVSTRFAWAMVDHGVLRAS